MVDDEHDEYGYPWHLADPRLEAIREASEREAWDLIAEIGPRVIADAHAHLEESLDLVGTAFAMMRRWEDALRVFNLLVRAVDGDDEAQAGVEVNRAWVLGHLDRGADALAATDRALSLTTFNRSRILLNRALALSHLSRNDEALAVLEEAAALDPNDGDIAFDRAGYLARAGRAEEGIAILAQAFALEPTLAAKADLDADVRLFRELPETRDRYASLVASASFTGTAHD